MKQTSHIAVDIGNSTTTIGFFPSRRDVFPRPSKVIQFSKSETEFNELRSTIAEGEHRFFLASVYQAGLQRILHAIEKEKNTQAHVLSNTDLPMQISVDFPERVGIDRLLGSLAACELNAKNSTSIVIDAGSAITIDAISTEKGFLGGVIFPGIGMQTAALNERTDQLPLIDARVSSAAPSIIGRNTAEAIRSGVFWGAIGSIREIVQRMQLDVGESEIYLTGGDLERISSFVPNAKFVPHLVLSGIAIAAQSILSNDHR